jgi:hypothetical protein
MIDTERHYDAPSWRPQLKSSEGQYYVSRRRKKKDAEYLHPDGWKLWAYYYADSQAARSALFEDALQNTMRRYEKLFSRLAAL